MWHDELNQLAALVGAWAQMSAMEVEPHEPVPGESLLDISGAFGRFYLEPAEFAGDELPATVWLYAYPTMRRVRLVGPENDRWQIQSSDGVPFHRELSQLQFETLLRDLSRNVA
jgi:hypothetical protein